MRAGMLARERAAVLCMGHLRLWMLQSRPCTSPVLQDAPLRLHPAPVHACRCTA